MLTVQDEVKRKAESNDKLEEELKGVIELAESSERLAGNTDWIRFKKGVELEVEGFEKSKFSVYDALINCGLTQDQKLEATDKIRALAQQIDNFKFIIGLVNTRIQLGVGARKQLEEIRRGK